MSIIFLFNFKESIMEDKGTLFIVVERSNSKTIGRFIRNTKVDKLSLKTFQVTEVTGSSLYQIGDEFYVSENELKCRPHYYKHEQ